MVRDWEATLVSWSKPPSDSEDARCGNAEKMINEAISTNTALNWRNIRVFTQGSYRHNTNVRLDSDVDIAICIVNTFYSEIPGLFWYTPIAEQKAIKSRYNIVDSPYTYPEFKNSVEAALISKFGRGGVTRGNKAIDVHANSYRVDADVVPCFEYRKYTGQFDSLGNAIYHSGTTFFPDNGGQIINWPEQNYANGVKKNVATNHRYKFVVRILKRLRNEMQSKQVKEASNIASFLIESLVWQISDTTLTKDVQYLTTVKNVLASLNVSISQDSSCSQWCEVNELKYLFASGQPWTRNQAHEFVVAALSFIERS